MFLPFAAFAASAPASPLRCAHSFGTQALIPFCWAQWIRSSQKVSLLLLVRTVMYPANSLTKPQVIKPIPLSIYFGNPLPLFVDSPAIDWPHDKLQKCSTLHPTLLGGVWPSPCKITGSIQPRQWFTFIHLCHQSMRNLPPNLLSSLASPPP